MISKSPNTIAAAVVADPNDRSTVPDITTKVAPRARMKATLFDLTMFIRFGQVRKTG